MHAVPGPQAIPQPPQLLLSVCVSTHTVPQSVWPIRQTSRHMPPVHVCEALQRAPQPPQFSWFDEVSTQAPLQFV